MHIEIVFSNSDTSSVDLVLNMEIQKRLKNRFGCTPMGEKGFMVSF